MSKYRVRKTYFVSADTLDEVKKDVDNLGDHHVLEIDLLEEDDGT